MVKWAPAKLNQYIEPFVGSGAIFFALKPKNARLSDLNERLIEAFQQVRDRPYQVREYLADYQSSHSKKFYYLERTKERRGPAARAAQFIYFNRTCWNGLYRVNRDGWFNVPIGTKTAVHYGANDIVEQSRPLQGAAIKASDFEDAIDSARAGDFIFVDPPYTVNHNLNGFVKYNEVLFSWQDQIRLRDALVRADRRGAFFILSNAAHQSVVELYAAFHQREIARHSVISGGSLGRGKTAELIVSNYLPLEQREYTGGGRPEAAQPFE